MKSESEYLGKVKLISNTMCPDQLCNNIARICYGSEYNSEAMSTSLLEKIIEEGHESVIEHAVFTFYLKDVSRVFTHELVRHRIASYTQKSTRYASNIAKVPVDYRGYGADIDNTINTVENLLKKGYEALVGAGMPKDEARYFLPMGQTTDIIVTMNARELRHFFKLRLCARATGEMQYYARRIYDICRGISPVMFKGCDAPCTEGNCEKMCEFPVVNRKEEYSGD